MKRSFADWSLAAGAALAFAVLAPLPAFAFSIRFNWSGIPACAKISPAFAVSGAPNGAVALRFVMHDEQAPAFHHGGSTVAYSDKRDIPRGAVHYVGPCPPGSDRHTYVWTAEALGRSGRVLGSATDSGVFPPK